MAISSLLNSVSGLTAAATRVGVTANNVANVKTVGTPDAENPDDAVYQAQDVQQSSVEPSGGTRAQVVDRQPQGGLLAYDPNSPLANGEGLVEAPNVDLGREITDLIQAESAYKANLKTLQTAEELEREVTDIIG